MANMTSHVITSGKYSHQQEDAIGRGLFMPGGNFGSQHTYFLKFYEP